MNTMEISLLEFLECGAFGLIRLGCTKEEILSHLDEPEDQGVRTHPQAPQLLQYGTSEFYLEFDRERGVFICKMIFLEASGMREDENILFPAPATIKDWELQPPCSFEDCVRFLSDSQVAFEQVGGESIEIQSVNGQVRLTFNEHKRLHSMSRLL